MKGRHVRPAGLGLWSSLSGAVGNATSRETPQFSDVFGGKDLTSRSILHRSLKAIGDHGSGVLVYLRRPSFGELGKQISSQDRAQKPSNIMREYGLGAQILRDLGVHRIDLLTGSKKNLVGIHPFGIEIVSQREIPN